MKVTTWILFLMIVFFTFLTFYSAYFNKVTDCGCFGDAIPFTPWQSFSKDVLLIILTGYLLVRRNKFDELTSSRTGHSIIVAVTLLSLVVGIYAIEHLPYIDFRAYKIGENIQVNMQPEEAPVFEYQFEKDGEIIFSQNYLTEDQGYTYIDYQVLNPEKSTPKITDYSIWNDDVGDYTQQTFQGDKLMIIVVDAEKASGENMEAVSALVNQLDGKVETISITSSDYESFENFRHSHQLATPYYYADGVVLKAMIRSNPGLFLLQDGTVKGKWHHNDVPDASTILELLGH